MKTPRLIADAIVPALPAENRTSARALIEQQLVPRMAMMRQFRDCPLEHLKSRIANIAPGDAAEERLRAILSFPHVLEVRDIAAQAEPLAIAMFVRERRIQALLVARLGPSSEISAALELDDQEIRRRAGILRTRLAAWYARTQSEEVSSDALRNEGNASGDAREALGYVLLGEPPSARLEELRRLANIAGEVIPPAVYYDCNGATVVPQ